MNFATIRGGLTVAVIALTSTVAVAADEFDFYGRLNVTLQNSDEAAGEQVELRNNSSRIGVKGEKALNAGLKAIYQLEFGVNLDGESGDDVFTHRNQFVGLEGAFGTVKVGRHDTALKQAQGSFDLFDDLEGDIGGVFNGENRLRNYIGYITPTFGRAFSATLNLFPGEDPDSADDGVADATSLSLIYKTDLIYAAIAYDIDIDGEDVDTTRVVGGYTFGAAQLMLLYQHTDAAAEAEDGFGASVAWTFGKNTAKFEYLNSEIWRINPQSNPLENRYETLISVGLDHALGEDTKLFAFYTAGDIGGTNESNRYLAIGIQHNF